MRTPEEHMGDLVKAYEEARHQPTTLSPHEVTVDHGVIAVLNLIRARDAEVRADERAKALAGFEVEAAPCGQTKWTPGADPLLKCIECTVPPTKHGDWHNAGGHRWRVTDELPVLTSRLRLVGPWKPVKEPEP